MKRILIIFTIVFAGYVVQAQIPGFAVKIMGGVNMSSFKMNQATTVKHKPHYAFSLDASLGKKNYLQAGMSMRRYVGEFTVNSVKSDLVFPSFGIHAFYGRQFLDLKVVKLRGFTGLNYELLDTPVSNGFAIIAEDYSPNVTNFVIGAEVKALMLLFSLQYEIGLTEMMPNTGIKNNILIAKVGISIL